MARSRSGEAWGILAFTFVLAVLARTPPRGAPDRLALAREVGITVVLVLILALAIKTSPL